MKGTEDVKFPRFQHPKIGLLFGLTYTISESAISKTVFTFGYGIILRNLVKPTSHFAGRYVTLSNDVEMDGCLVEMYVESGSFICGRAENALR